MKLSNTVVSMIVIAAVLVFAYAIGLLIRQARTGSAHTPAAREVNEGAFPQRMVPSAARTKDTPEERMRLKEEKVKAIEDMSSPTPEQKEKFRNKVRKQVGGGRSSRGLPNVSPQPGPTQKARKQSQSQAGPARGDANAPVAPGASTSPKPSTDNAGAGAGKAGPGQP